MTVKKKIGTVMLVMVVLAAVCASAFIGARLGVSAPDPLTRIMFEADVAHSDLLTLYDPLFYPLDSLLRLCIITPKRENRVKTRLFRYSIMCRLVLFCSLQ